MRRKIQGGLLAILVLGVVAGGLYFVRYYTLEILPRRAEYRRALMEMRSTEVRAMSLSTGSTNEYGHFVATEKRQLDEREIATLLPMINQAKSYVPDHAHGGWLGVLEIETSTALGHCEFEVHVSENNGVLLNLHSRGRSGWNYGTLRNDAMEPLLKKLVAPERAQSAQ